MRKSIAAAALAALATSAALGAAVTLGPGNGTASSHREAPLIADDPSADLTDVYAFRSPDRPSTVTILQVPACSTRLSASISSPSSPSRPTKGVSSRREREGAS